MSAEAFDDVPDPIAYVGGLARPIDGDRLHSADLQRLGSRAGCFEALLEDPRVIDFLWQWAAPGLDRAELDQLSDPSLEDSLLEQARAFVDSLGLPTRWLAEELVRERGRRLRASVFGLDPRRVTATAIEDLLDEAREGSDTAPSVVNVRVDVHRRKAEGNAAFLERVDAEIRRAMVKAGYYRLASWAADAPAGRPADRAHGLSEDRARSGGRAYYLAKLRTPRLAGAELRTELGETDPSRVSRMIKEAGPRLEDVLPT